mgnify:CR=1 FL=1
MLTLLIASNNQHKIEEIKQIFSSYRNLDINIISIADGENKLGYKLGEPIEDKETFEENAYIKASYYKKYFKDYLVVADDTGLMVDALNGRPGVHSHRYSEPNPTSEKNRKKLLDELSGIENRSASFKTALCLIDLNNEVHYFTGVTNGLIMDHEIGANGFGYDSLFYSSILNKPFAECTMEEKSQVSHRGYAFRCLIDYLDEYIHENKS